MRRLACALVALALGLGFAAAEAAVDAAPAAAQGKKVKKKTTKKKTSGKKKKSKASKATVPLQIGLGPAFYFITGPLQEDQAPHYGVQIYARAIIEGENLKRARKKVPKKYRGFLAGEEVRIGHLLVPDALIISPRTEHTAIYGATWRPLAVEPDFGSERVRFTVGAGLMLTYAYISTELTPEQQAAQPDLHNGTTHFFRPGVDLRAVMEVKLAEQWLFSVGWSSAFYPPQELGGDFLAWGSLERSAWHFGQAFALLHYRLPYQTSF